MKIHRGQMVALGYGKYFRSESIVGIEPVQEGRGPGRRSRVHIEGLSQPVIASRSEDAILEDLVKLPGETMKTREHHELLTDILDTIVEINPVLRSIIRDQGHWDIDRLEDRIRESLSEEDSSAG